MTTFALKDIRPNPFRHMERYPVRRDKVDALRESIRTTEFWNNIVARAIDDDGQPVYAEVTDLIAGAEIAYGHHRLVALREEYGEDHAVDLILRDLDDTTMLQIMARENAEEWGADASIEQETMRAVVTAFAEGRVELSAPPAKTHSDNIRYAPHFSLECESTEISKPYTVDTVAQFLGWSRIKARRTLQALAAVEDEEVSEDTYAGLGPAQADAVTREASRAKKRAESQGATPDEAKHKASEVAAAVSDGMKTGKVGVQHVRPITDAHVPPTPQQQPPQMDGFARDLAKDINRVLNRDSMAEKMDALLPYAADLNPIARRELASCLRQLADRADGYRNRLADSDVIEISSGGNNA